ncbi:MAG TPA: ATP phosphoribosyltransferase regulatory subunit [Stellaceae bacterium]|jgi:ATP phosphoribosyltransferase regulatory subunit|nr:ATP phosphoribosyltransferase regulatory subunit [Stellaceae bacterium]
MSDAPHPALLPTGMHDLLPPEAEIEASVVAQLMATLTAHGYERVKPPLVEFEETLFSGAGAAMATSTFRMMDPVSHRMIGVRADMTPQIARIAATRLGGAPRPLRLSYAGQVLRVRGSEIRPERQVGQVGAELIGAAEPVADVEAIAVAGAALAALGVPRLTVDITLPTLVPAIGEAYGVGGERAAALRAALDHKDAAAVTALAGKAGKLLERLLLAAGPAAATLAALDRLDLPSRARAERARLGAVLDGLAVAAPELKVTVDPVENRGFEYHTGISFTFFAGGSVAHGPLGELGRGGRYDAGDPAAPEPATGFTLYTDTILRALPEALAPRRVLLPFGTDCTRANALRAAGWVTVAALAPVGDWWAEAHRLGCSHVLEGENPVAVG